MYNRAYGVIATLAPLHVGATAGEETGNLNLIFRDQFTQTGIIPGSSIRGRFRAEMRDTQKGQVLKKDPNKPNKVIVKPTLQYLELITFFPDDSPESEKFLDFLNTNPDEFQQLWGE